MRYFFAFAVLLFVGSAWSDIPTDHKSIAQKEKKTEKPNNSATLDTSSLEKTKREAVKEASEKTDPHAESKLSTEGELVKYTAQLSLDTERLADFTKFLVIVTAILAAIAIGQLWIILKQLGLMKTAVQDGADAANAAIAANELSRKALIVDQRPWVSLDVQPSGSLAYDDKRWDAGLRWHIPLEYKLKNIGKTPAINVSFFGKMIPFVLAHWPTSSIKNGVPQGLPISGTDLTKEFEEVCGFHEGLSDAKMGWGRIMFPNEEGGGSQFGMNANPAIFDAVKESPEGYAGQFLVVVCVTYGSSLSEDKYRTAKAFQLHKLTGTRSIDLNGETIPVTELGFDLSPVNGSHAR